MKDLYGDIDRVLIDEKQIEARTRELARQIEADYKDTEDLLLICVLKGGYVFLSDLSRALARPHDIDFMGVSSYGAGTQSSGAVQIIMDLKQPIAGRNVLIVEDIIDSGLTLNYLLKSLRVRRPESLEVAALLVKEGIQRTPLDVKYTGFTIGPEFVIGYGLDYAGKFRNLPYVGVMDESSL